MKAPAATGRDGNPPATSDVRPSIHAERDPDLLACIPPFAGSILCLVMFQAVGGVFLGGYNAAVGSLRLPVAEHMQCLALWTVFGSAAACLLAVALFRLPRATLGRLRQVMEGGADRRWLFIACAAALLIPVFLRVVVLQRCPVTDDETCYAFLGRLLASGRLKVASPPAKLFYDHTFMVNDGHFYPQYFAGWPLVMAPFVRFHIEGFANAVCCAATVPALYAILKTVSGRLWARCGLLLYLVSPFAMIAAATQLSHTSCILALTWMIAVFIRIREGQSRGAAHAAFFALFCLAFLIRPTAALGVGAPFLVAWVLALRRGTWRDRALALSCGGLVSLAGALVFMGINAAQTGSPFLPAYQRYVTYAIENGCRFSYLPSVELARKMQLTNMDFRDPWQALAMLGTAVFRMNTALFGWPFSLCFVPFGLAVRRASLLSWSLLTFVAVHFFISDVGVDVFGPVHYSETIVPLIVLTVAGMSRLALRMRLPAAGAGHAAASRTVPFVCLLAMALCIVSLAGYILIRLKTLHAMAAHISRPLQAVASLNAGPVVVFTAWPYAPWTAAGAPQHFVLHPPVNDPDLQNPALWLNHISVADDRRCMQFHPGRKGFVLSWLASGNFALIPLDELKPGDVPDGRVGGSGEGPDWNAIEKQPRRGAR